MSTDIATATPVFRDWRNVNRIDNEYTISGGSLSDIDTNHATFIDWQNSKGNNRRWLRFDQYNKGTRNFEYGNAAYQSYQFKEYLIHSVADQMGVTKWEHGQAKRLFFKLDLQKLGEESEAVAVALCLYVMHTDEDDLRKCHPNSKAEEKPTEIQNLEQRFWTPEQTVLRLYGKIEHHIRTERLKNSEREFDKYGWLRTAEGTEPWNNESDPRYWN